MSARKYSMSELGTYKDKLARRIALGLDECDKSRAEIAEALGYKHAGSLSKWATGETTPGPENLARLALATGLSLDWVLAERGTMFPPSDLDPLKLQVIGKIVDEKIDEATLRHFLDRAPSVKVGEDREALGLEVQTGFPGKPSEPHSKRRKS